MDKRTVSAIILSMLVLVTWSLLTRRNPQNTQVIENKTVTDIKIPEIKTSQDPLSKLQSQEINIGENQASFIPSLAAIKEIKYPKYNNYVFSLRGLYLDGLNAGFAQTSVGLSPAFVYSDAEKSITQEYKFSKFNNTIELSLKIQNKKSEDLTINLPFILSSVLKPSGDEARFQSQEIIIKTPDRILRSSPWKDIITPEPIKFIAYRERYFCAILQPQDGKSRAFIKKLNSSGTTAGVVLDAQLPANKEVTMKFLLYLGPQDEAVLKSINPDWSEIVNYGFFTPISKFLLEVLRFLFKIVHNWGVAIILLSLLIYFVLFPLSIQQLRSMKEMQAIQPKVEELRKIYKDNPQKLNKEIMELYKEHKVNPFGGCLPLILQIPVFFALYQALMRSLELKGASFLWIKDLSRPDELFTLPVQLPILGNQVNILPLLMCVVMFLQQKMTSKASAVSSEQQKMMLILFPVMFGIIFYHMPAGLVMYWFINSLLMFVYQLKISKPNVAKE